MIALIQMLGTARRVREYIGLLQAGPNESFASRVVGALKHDFVEKSGGDRAVDRECFLGQCCNLLTDGQNVKELSLIHI